MPKGIEKLLFFFDVQCFGVGGHLICKTATATSAQTARWPLDRSGRGALINVDICRLTKHILHNGAMKARARKVYFKSRCKKLACETFKSLDSCAPTKKRGWIIRLAFDNRTDKERKKGRGVELWPKQIAMFCRLFNGDLFLNRCCCRFINPSNQSLTEIMHWLTVPVVTLYPTLSLFQEYSLSVLCFLIGRPPK